MNYNQQFWKTYLKNEINFALIKELKERTAELQELVKEVEVDMYVILEATIRLFQTLQTEKQEEEQETRS